MKTPVLLLVSSLALGACVSRGRYDQAVSTTETTRAELQRTQSQLGQSNAEIADLRKQIADLQQSDASKSGDVVASRARIGALQHRLADLEAAQRAAEVRATVYRNLTLRLQKQIDAGDLAVVIRDGRMVLQLPNDVLFDTGQTELKPAGKSALKAISDVLKTMPERQFQIAGHTDDVPIHNDRFTSNWELSSARALRVLHFLIGEGTSAKALSAAGYSEVDPIAANTSPEGRKKNRRTEITLQPNIDELVKLP
jgi:chemotaxis protein MotB